MTSLCTLSVRKNAGAAIWLPDTSTFFMELSTMHDYESTATTKRHSYSARFFRLLCSQTGRIRKNFKCSNYENRRIIYAQEINLIGYLHQLLGIFTWTCYDVTSRELQKNPRGTWTGLRSSQQLSR